MAKNRHFRIGNKVYYIHEDIAKMCKELKISNNEIEREYHKMVLFAPFGSDWVTYNHAIYRIAERKRRGAK